MWRVLSRLEFTTQCIEFILTEDGMNRLKGMVLGVAFMALPAIAQGQTITFDDVNTTPVPPSPLCQYPLLPNGYHGLNWDNFYVLKGSGYVDVNPLIGYTHCLPPSGYWTGVVSSPNVAFNNGGDPAEVGVSSGNTFTFNSVYMTSAWRDGLNVLVQGYHGATLLYHQLLVVNTYAPTLEVFNWTGVDAVWFTPSGGDPSYYIGDGTYVAIDDLTVSNVTPEPATLLLLATGLAGIGGVIRRRRQKKNIDS